MAPTSDAGFPIRFDTSAWKDRVDADTLRWLTELRKAQLGESADLDGDGVRELSVTHTASGSTKWVWQPFHVRFQVEHFADGRRLHQIGYDNNGYWAEQTMFGPADGQAVFSYDKNNNDKFDRRISRSAQTDGGLLWVEELDDLEKGTWVEKRRWMTHPWADQLGSGGDGCNGTKNMPGESLFTAQNMPGVTILGDQAPGGAPVEAGCSLKHASRLGAALSCARKRLECLERANPAIANNFASHLASDEWTMGCKNPCPDRDATTLARTGRFAAKTNFSTDALDNASDDELCALVLHEGMHMAETAYHPKEHDADGSDQIYACAHYCGGCTSRGPAKPPPTPSQDCVTCAGANINRRRACGEKSDWQSVNATYNVCTGGLGTLMAACTDWMAPVRSDCKDGVLFVDGPAGCCNACPTNAPTNSKPCTGKPMPMTDNCSMKPPECR